jgi:hypothetical protein
LAPALLTSLGKGSENTTAPPHMPTRAALARRRRPGLRPAGNANPESVVCGDGPEDLRKARLVLTSNTALAATPTSAVMCNDFALAQS